MLAKWQRTMPRSVEFQDQMAEVASFLISTGLQNFQILQLQTSTSTLFKENLIVQKGLIRK